MIKVFPEVFCVASTVFSIVRQFPVCGAGVLCMFVCVQGIPPSMLAVLLPVCVRVCVYPPRGLVFSVAVGVWEQVVSVFCVPTCGLVTSVCEQLCGFLFCTAF